MTQEKMLTRRIPTGLIFIENIMYIVVHMLRIPIDWQILKFDTVDNTGRQVDNTRRQQETSQSVFNSTATPCSSLIPFFPSQECSRLFFVVSFEDLQIQVQKHNKRQKYIQLQIQMCLPFQDCSGLLFGVSFEVLQMKPGDRATDKVAQSTQWNLLRNHFIILSGCELGKGEQAKYQIFVTYISNTNSDTNTNRNKITNNK